MNFKTTLFLVVLVAIVGLVWWLAPKSAAPTGAAADKPKATLETKPLLEPAIDENRITRVELEQPQRPKVVIERVTSDPNQIARGQITYRLVEPVAAAAESWVARNLITNLTSLQVRERFEPGSAGAVSAADAGLEPPLATVRLTEEDGKTTTVEVGKRVVMSEDTYVRLGGAAAIYIAKRDLPDQVRKDPSEFRAKTLLDYKVDEVVGVRVVHDGKTYLLSKDASGDWLIESPVRAVADAEKVRSLLTKGPQLRVEEFAGDAAASDAVYGFDQPFLTFNVSTRPPAPVDTQPASAPATQTQTLVVGAASGLAGQSRYARPAGAGWAARVPEQGVQSLIPNLRDLRDTRVARLKAADVTRIEVASDGQSVAVDKVDGAWAPAADAGAVDVSAVIEMLAAIETLRAADFVDDAGADPRDPSTPYGLAQPRATITLTRSGQVEPLTLRIGATTPSGRTAYVQRNDDPTLIVVQASQVERLAAGVMGLRSREVLALDPAQIARVEARRGDGGSRIATRAAGAWLMVEPEGAPPGLDAIGALATNVARLRASRVVALDDAVVAALKRPALTLKIDVIDAADAAAGPTAAPATQSHQLVFANTPDGVIGRLDEQPAAFALDDAVYRIISAELVDARLLGVTAEQLRRIAVVSPAGELAFVREGGTWIYEPDRYVQLAQDKVNQLAAKLAGLRVEAFEAWGGADPLENARSSIRVATGADDSGDQIELSFGPVGGEACDRRGLLAGAGRRFTITTADCQLLFARLDEYLKSDKPAAPATPAMPPRPQP